MEFFAAPMDTLGLLERLAEHAPLNPFCDPSYFNAMRRLGSDPWVAGMREGDQVLSAAGVFLRRGRLNSTLEITSLPTAANTEGFWFGLLRFGAEHGITQIEANSFASPPCNPPPLPGEQRRQIRHEFVLDLTLDDFDQRMSRKHRQCVRKAIESGMRLRWSSDREACREHLRIVNAALDRKRQRGQQIERLPGEDRFFPFLESGAGELFQAVLHDEPVASALVLRSRRGAYYQTAGALPEALALGTSVFLIHGIAQALRSEGVDVFNLGGAEKGSGLAQFKTRFGSTVVSSTAVTLNIGPLWRKKLTTLVRLVRENPGTLRERLLGRLSVFKVYAMETSAKSDLVTPPGTAFRALPEEELRQLEVDRDGFAQRQKERLVRFGQSHAYGVFVDNHLAHVSWLLPQRAMRLDQPAVVPDSGACAEISGCETLAEFRGRCLYPFAIRNLCRVAAGQGISRIYMKTDWHNKPSQRGIRKAGLHIVGIALLVVPPLLSERTWVFRLYR